MKQIIFCLLSLLFLACNSGSSSISTDTTRIGYSDSATQVADSTHPKDRANLNYKIDTSSSVTKTLLQPRDTLLTVKLHNGKGSVKAFLSGTGKHVTIVVPVEKGDSITAEIVPDNYKTNVRINQIFIPVGKEGKYDGPFSRTISYPITVKGNYKLIVGSNLMAEGEASGSFTCNVAIK